ncbi:hypothetical protein BDC45DRAFT_568326 [Circinella umbellata]|nr:hypothetical protein BDC45DRAFT_568326 [Circinella umbellata]
MESGFASVKIATAAVVDILKQEQEENEEELLRREEQDLLLAIGVRETEILDYIPFESITRLMTEAALRARIVQEDFFFEIYWANPAFVMANETRRPRQQRAFESIYWWTIRYPNLRDDARIRNSFKADYRITLRAFTELVDELKGRPEYAGSQAKDGYPVEIQVAVVLWRFANSMFGFRVMQETLGISDGSYTNFTDRFISAMQVVSHKYITWPKDDLVRTREIAEGFIIKSTREKPRLPSVIGAMDGKLVVIQKHARYSDFYHELKLTRWCLGRTNDARGFRSSALYKRMLRISERMCMDRTVVIAGTV